MDAYTTTTPDTSTHYKDTTYTSMSSNIVIARGNWFIVWKNIIGHDSEFFMKS